MRIKKKNILEKLDPDAIANQTKEIVGVVQDELDSDESTAKSFVKSMTVSENDLTEDDETIDYGEKDIPLNNEINENRKVVKRVKIKNLR